ncbi:MAG TPA: ABC transporter permease [Gaiellaceae bacterium]|nr:ABC transporter permease [Gaiellaceae bacterium]
MESLRRSDLQLLARWIHARVRVILRTPRTAFFGLIFPLILLALLNATNSGSSVTVAGGKVDFAQYFTPSIGIYALAVSCFTTPIFGLANARDLGILKRIRGTPVSPWIYLTSWLAAGIVTGLAAMTVMVVVSVPAFHLHVYARLLPAAIVTAVLGAATLGALGLVVSTFVRRAETAPTIANLTLFPVLFLSGVFFPLQSGPGWAETVAHLLPLSHLVEAFTACFSPHTHGSGFAAGDLAVMAAWGIGALAFAARRFTWESESDEDVPHRAGGLRSILQRG